jgi:acetyl-CoA synthetase
MGRATGHEAYRAVCHLLVRHRDDDGAATAQFRWPDVGDRINGALDWLDAIAAGTSVRRCA